MTASFQNIRPILPWEELRTRFEAFIQSSFGDWVNPTDPHYQSQCAFALGRLDEGLALARYFDCLDPSTRRSIEAPPLRVLDIGAGNGGVSLGLANDPRFHVTALDTLPNPSLRTLRRSTSLPVAQIVASGEQLPLGTETYHIVLLLETLEHVRNARALSGEIMRVLRPGGVCMITTPPRLRYFFQPDPHFGITGLFLLPDRLQRLYVTRFASRRFGASAYYDVQHIFWHAHGIARLFPKPRRIVLFHPPAFLPVGRRKRSLKRHLFGGFFWDRILVYKPI